MTRSMIDTPLSPGSTIGIFGDGQLGRMLAIAATQLGFKVHIFSPQHGSPAFDVAAFHTTAAYSDLDAVKAFASEVDVATVEFENIPLDTYEHAGKFTCIAPDTKALATSQDRLAEKRFLCSHDIPVAPFVEIDGEADIATAVQKLGPAGLLKTRKMGYDGKGQIRLKADAHVAGANSPGVNLEEAIKAFSGAPSIFEALVNFELEISCVAARDWAGNIVFYDSPRNEHRHQILAESHVPANISEDLEKLARTYTAKIAEKLNYVGVLTVEFFVPPAGSEVPLIVNEIAPRVHNSGHWTMDACSFDQFENHIRAIAGWTLGNTQRHSNAKMINLIGSDMEGWAEFAGSSSANLHLYGKGEARAGRKMGHVTYLSGKN